MCYDMRKLIHWISNIYLLIAILCMLALISILSAEIVLRYFLNSSIIWSQELFSILITWITFLGFGKIVENNEDIKITFLVNKMNKSLVHIIKIIISALLFFTSSILIFYTVTLAIRNVNRTTIIMKASN